MNDTPTRMTGSMETSLSAAEQRAIVAFTDDPVARGFFLVLLSTLKNLCHCQDPTHPEIMKFMGHLVTLLSTRNPNNESIWLELRDEQYMILTWPLEGNAIKLHPTVEALALAEVPARRLTVHLENVTAVLRVIHSAVTRAAMTAAQSSGQMPGLGSPASGPAPDEQTDPPVPPLSPDREP